MRPPSESLRDHQRLLAAASLWLIAGAMLLLTTLVPAHTALLGWTPAFWLVLAPLVAVLGLEPKLPFQLLTRRHSRRRAAHARIWH